MNDRPDCQSENSFVIAPNYTTSAVHFDTVFVGSNPEWIMKITQNGKIEFNRDAYPNLGADDFAQQVLKILESSVVRR